MRRGIACIMLMKHRMLPQGLVPSLASYVRMLSSKRSGVGPSRQYWVALAKSINVSGFCIDTLPDPKQSNVPWKPPGEQGL